MRRFVAAMVVLTVALVLTPRGLSSAQSAGASSYALTASDFPPGSQIVESEVASNEYVAFHHLLIGPAPPPGRITGYYMQARSVDSAGRIRLVTSYLVSLYSSPEVADTAFVAETGYWTGLSSSGATARPLAPDAFGDPGQQHWYALSTGGNTHSELYFRRGAVFVQLNLDSFGSTPTAAETDAFLAMAKKLDLIAGRPATPTTVPTATTTPTPRPTATRTATPTATATRVRPTSTPTLVVRPVKETKPCKKGYKRVKGKCRKA